MRSVPEWIGTNHDVKIPDRVRVRVFARYGGKCHLSGRVIRPGEPWDCDHVVALINGGEHRESNLAPALRDKHREKTAEDAAYKAKIYRKTKMNLGVSKRGGRPMPGSRASGFKRRMDGTVERRQS